MNFDQGIAQRLDFAVGIAREAGELTLLHYQTVDLDVDQKADDTPVTRADKEAEQLLRERIASGFRRDAIIGEEFSERRGDSGFVWYLDPIDGTQSFIRGVPMYGTMVAVERGGEPVIGVIVFPALGELVYASKGSGAWWAIDVPPLSSSSSVPGLRRAQVSDTEFVGNACISATSVERFATGESEERLRLLMSRAKLSRGWSDCYGHYLVATGRIDAMIDPEMNVWDNAPLLPIIEEAGGRFTDVRGEATIHGVSAISTNGLIHDEVLGFLQGRL